MDKLRRPYPLLVVLIVLASTLAGCTTTGSRSTTFEYRSPANGRPFVFTITQCAKAIQYQTSSFSAAGVSVPLKLVAGVPTLGAEKISLRAESLREASELVQLADNVQLLGCFAFSRGETAAERTLGLTRYAESVSILADAALRSNAVSSEDAYLAIIRDAKEQINQLDDQAHAETTYRENQAEIDKLQGIESSGRY